MVIKNIVSALIILSGTIMIQCENKLDKNHAQLSADNGKEMNVIYTNYRGETAERTIIPVQVYWGQTEYHPGDQWLLKVWDVEKNAERIYALRDCNFKV